MPYSQYCTVSYSILRQRTEEGTRTEEKRGDSLTGIDPGDFERFQNLFACVCVFWVPNLEHSMDNTFQKI